MEAEKLKKTSFVLSLLGIFVLFLVSAKIEPKKIEVCEINSTKENEIVVMCGKVAGEKQISENSSSSPGIWVTVHRPILYLRPLLLMVVNIFSPLTFDSSLLLKYLCASSTNIKTVGSCSHR